MSLSAEASQSVPRRTTASPSVPPLCLILKSIQKKVLMTVRGDDV
nr:MAG TPA: hypothetical protein [Caudoviricetes sp.]